MFWWKLTPCRAGPLAAPMHPERGSGGGCAEIMVSRLGLEFPFWCTSWHCENSQSPPFHALPSLLSAVTLRLDLCEHQPIAKDFLKSKLLPGDLMVQQRKWISPKFIRLFTTWVKAFVMNSLFSHSVRLEGRILCVKNLDTHKYEIFCRETITPKHLS